MAWWRSTSKVSTGAAVVESLEVYRLSLGSQFGFESPAVPALPFGYHKSFSVGRPRRWKTPTDVLFAYPRYKH